jgi:hypothetical protein
MPKNTNGLESEATSCAIPRHIYIKHVSVFRQKQERASATMTSVLTAVSGHTTGTGNLGHKLCRNSFFLFFSFI